jgi:hypothetical protein
MVINIIQSVKVTVPVSWLDGKCQINACIILWLARELTTNSMGGK